MVLYDHIYDVEDYFGKPYKELISFFKKLPYKGHILDLGCGQGKDAVPLAQLGYRVTGIDVSQLGIKQLNEKAKKMNLKLNGLVDDMFTFKIEEKYDVVILDSMLHFEKDDKENEIALLDRISREIKTGGIICICIWKSVIKEKLIKDIFLKSQFNWQILNDSYVNYTFKDAKSDHKVDMIYHMFITRKEGIVQ